MAETSYDRIFKDHGAFVFFNRLGFYFTFEKDPSEWGKRGSGEELLVPEWSICNTSLNFAWEWILQKPRIIYN